MERDQAGPVVGPDRPDMHGCPVDGQHVARELGRDLTGRVAAGARIKGDDDRQPLWLEPARQRARRQEVPEPTRSSREGPRSTSGMEERGSSEARS